MRRGPGFIIVIRENLKVSPLADEITKAALSPRSVGPTEALNSRSPAIDQLSSRSLVSVLCFNSARNTFLKTW